jgi:hypothetical protein
MKRTILLGRPFFLLPCRKDTISNHLFPKRRQMHSARIIVSRLPLSARGGKRSKHRVDYAV